MKKERDTNIDLLRILSMLMIVVLHVNQLSGSLTKPFTDHMAWHLSACASESLSLVAVNIYAFITGYVCLYSNWQARKLAHVLVPSLFWAAVLFLFIPIAPEVLVPAPGENLRLLLFSYLPTPYWYVNAYIALFFCIPFLNKILTVTPRTTYLRLLIFLLFILPISGMFFKGVIADGYNALWLGICYCAGAYCRRFPVRLSRITLLIIILLCVGCTLFFRLYTCFVSPMLRSFYTAPFILLSSLAMFVFIIRMPQATANVASIIKFITPMTFGVYLIHTHPATWALEKTWIPRIVQHFDYAWWSLPIIALTVFIICVIVEHLRCRVFALLHLNELCTSGLNRLLHQAHAGLSKLENSLH